MFYWENYKKRKHPNFEFDILTTSGKNIVTYVQYEKMDKYQNYVIQYFFSHALSRNENCGKFE